MKYKSNYNNHYSHGVYSRGATRNRDVFLENLKARYCLYCDSELKRKQYRWGLESLPRFHKRMTCGLECKNKLWQSNPEYTPNYKGIMHTPCRVCGSFVKAYAKQKLCGKCWSENRPISYNRKKVEKLLVCEFCNKEFSNRVSIHRFREEIKGKIFCSVSCAVKKRWERTRK